MTKVPFGGPPARQTALLEPGASACFGHPPFRGQLRPLTGAHRDYAPSMPVIRPYQGTAPTFADGVFVADTASVVGDVQLEEQVSVWYGAVLRADVGKIRVGARTNIQDNACVHMTWEVSDALIGADVVVGHNAVIHGARVGDGALIGIGAVVLDNACIGEGAWVAAGSVVPPNAIIPKGMLAVGTPAKPFRAVKDAEREWARGAIERYLGLAAEHFRQQAAERGKR